MRKVDITALAITPAELKRFWAKVDRSDGPEACWPWIGSKYRTGYGRFWLCRAGVVIPVLPHRLAFFLSTAINPMGHFVCHACDSKPCTNPLHLWLGSNSENIRDAIAKGLKPPSGGVLPGEQNGFSKLTSASVVEIRTRYSAGGTTSRRLAREYGLGKSQVLRILRGEAWRHIQASAEVAP